MITNGLKAVPYSESLVFQQPVKAARMRMFAGGKSPAYPKPLFYAACDDPTTGASLPVRIQSNRQSAVMF
jgi:hypothetical protein